MGAVVGGQEQWKSKTDRTGEKFYLQKRGADWLVVMLWWDEKLLSLMNKSNITGKQRGKVHGQYKELAEEHQD